MNVAPGDKITFVFHKKEASGIVLDVLDKREVPGADPSDPFNIIIGTNHPNSWELADDRLYELAEKFEVPRRYLYITPSMIKTVEYMEDEVATERIRIEMRKELNLRDYYREKLWQQIRDQNNRPLDEL